MLVLGQALTRAINDYAKKSKMTKDNGDTLTGDDVREGLTAILSVKVPEPQFEGQTKTKLATVKSRALLKKLLMQRLLCF